MNNIDKQDPIYRIVFQQQAEVYELYAQYIYQSDLHGFIEVEQLLFGEKSQLLVDPGEERLKTLFHDVTRTFIPMPAIIRIDEVSRAGTPTVSEGGSNVRPFPVMPFPARDH